MRKIITTITCDLHPKADATDTMRFVWNDGAEREVDLCLECHDDVAPLLNAARLVPGARAKATGRPTRRDPAQTERIRSWARQNGYEVKDRGRIPRSIEDAYVKARAA